MSGFRHTHADRAVPVTNPSDDRSPAAKAYQWASRIMVVSLEMVLPGLAGHWLDEQLGTVVLFLLVGLGLGCTAAIVPFDSDDSLREAAEVATDRSRVD